MPLHPSVRLALPLALAGPMLLAGCGGPNREVPNGNSVTANISIGNTSEGDGSGNATQSVSINVPGFSAKVDVPNLHLGSDTTQIEDMKIYPGTKITNVNIVGQAGDGSGGDTRGNVLMDFSAPGQPAQVVDWYKQQAQKAGWVPVPPTGANQFEATKQKDGGQSRFALSVLPGQGGSTGHFAVTGTD